MEEHITGACARNCEGVVVVGETVHLAARTASAGQAKPHRVGRVVRLAHHSGLSPDVIAYLPNAPLSSTCVLVRWFYEVPTALRTFDANAFRRAARCSEVVLLLEESWVCIEDLVGTSLVWDVEDIQRCTHIIEGMADAYVIAHEQAPASQKRKRKQKEVNGYRLRAVKADEWSALAEASDCITDRFGKVATHTSLGGLRWATVTWMRNRVATGLVRSTSSTGFSLQNELFTGQMWDVFAGGVAAAGGPDTSARLVETTECVETPDGCQVRRNTEDWEHKLALDCRNPAHLKSMDAVLGTGWNWARREQQFAAAGGEKYVPMKATTTLCMVRFLPKPPGKKGRTKYHMVFTWRQHEQRLGAKVLFVKGSAGALNAKFGIFPSLAG